MKVTGNIATASVRIDTLSPGDVFVRPGHTEDAAGARPYMFLNQGDNDVQRFLTTNGHRGKYAASTLRKGNLVAYPGTEKVIKVKGELKLS